jgi:hypothetical protein
MAKSNEAKNNTPKAVVATPETDRELEILVELEKLGVIEGETDNAVARAIKVQDADTGNLSTPEAAAKQIRASYPFLFSPVPPTPKVEAPLSVEKASVVAVKKDETSTPAA